MKLGTVVKGVWGMFGSIDNDTVDAGIAWVTDAVTDPAGADDDCASTKGRRARTRAVLEEGMVGAVVCF